MNIISFLKKEKKELFHFLASFQIVGLSIATVIGLSLNNSTTILSEQIIMPFIETLFSINNYKKFKILFYGVDINIGLFIAEIIRLLCVIIIMYIVYSIIKKNANAILENKSTYNNDSLKSQNNRLNELKKLNNQIELLNTEIKNLSCKIKNNHS